MFALSLVPALARGEIEAPSLVEEDLPVEGAAAPTPEGEPQPDLPPSHARRSDAAAAAPARPPRAAGAAPEAAPPRAIEPVRASFADVLAAWDERRAALRDQDAPRAGAAERRLLELKRELDLDAMPAFAVAEARAVWRSLWARTPAEAVARAELAVKLAPDLPDAHLSLAAARLARDPSSVGAAFGEVEAAAAAVARDPRTARALLGDALAAALAALLATAVAMPVLLFLRHARLALHDLRHLPGVRHGTPLQVAFAAAALLALPLALRLGPGPVVAAVALAAAPYLRRAELLLATASLCALTALPLGARAAAGACAWAGTVRDDAWTVEHGADDGRAAARLAARAERGELPPVGLLALGRHHKRRGDLDRAARLYEAAGLSRPDALVDLGNVQLLRGDEEAARASYLAATDRADASAAVLAAAHWDLSKIYLRRSALEQAQEARRRALQEAPAVVEAHGLDDDPRANRWLLDAPLRDEELGALRDAGAPGSLSDAVLARLAGPLPASWWPWAPLAAVALLWGAALGGRRAGASARCARCGGPACARCGEAAEEQCEACVNAFVKRGVVDARDRLRKEAQVRRRAGADRIAARALAFAAAGAGDVWRGAPWRGALSLFALAFLAAVLLLRGAVLPPPYPSPWLGAAELALAAPLALAVWAWTLRGVFARTRS